MKVREVRFNNRRRVFEVRTPARTLVYPYAKARPAPTSADPVVAAASDPEIGREGFVFTLASGRSGDVHIDEVLAYDQDPAYVREALLYKLTLEAQARIEDAGLSRREIIRRLGTSASQLYRLLDQTNYRKSIDQMLALLQVLGCEVDVVISRRAA